ncbi:MAG: copper resistance CopC family protein [Microbacteriaceae bacterium]
MSHSILARVISALGALAIATALAVVPAMSATAHDYLVDSTPAAGSVQSAPLSEISLTFNDVVLDLSGDGSSTLMQVTGPGAATNHFETGCPTAVDRTVTQPVALGGPGSYTITYQIVSADGHTVSSSLQFSYQPPAGTTEAAGTASGPNCGANSSAGPSAAPQPAQTPQNNSADAANDSGNLGIVIGIGGVIVGLAVIGVVVVLVSSRKKRVG